MNREEFRKYIANQHSCTQIEAEKAIDMFTNSMIKALGGGNEVRLLGFGSFSVSESSARVGRNPRTGENLEIPAINRAKFKSGNKLKEALNKK